jgi:predicted alpha/beta hydrolase family esterase
VPLKKGEILRDKLGADLIVVPKGSHLNEGAGFTELPIVLENLLKISKVS